MSRVLYASTVRSLMFAMIYIIPNMVNPSEEHCKAVKKILRYIKGTSNVALCYEGSGFASRIYI